MTRAVMFVVACLLASCECASHERAPECARTAPPLSAVEACDALGNAWLTTSADECGPFRCPYDAPVSSNDVTTCVVGLLDIVDASGECVAREAHLAACAICEER